MLMMKFKGINQVQYLKRRGPHLAFFMQSRSDFPQQQKGCMSYSVFGPPAILRRDMIHCAMYNFNSLDWSAVVIL